MKLTRLFTTLILAVAALVAISSSLQAQSASDLDRDSAKALRWLYANNPKAREFGKKAHAVLVFPNVIKGGFFIGAAGGNGVLFKNGEVDSYYNTSAISYGLQFGGQTYGYALFFMNNKAISYLHNSEGWEIGVGPSIVVVDAGAAKSYSSTTAQKDIYAFIFDQKGLMAGLGVQGSKITEYYPSE